MTTTPGTKQKGRVACGVVCGLVSTILISSISAGISAAQQKLVPIVRQYIRDTNTTKVKAPLTQFSENTTVPIDYRGLKLMIAQYSYPGRTPIRPIEAWLLFAALDNRYKHGARFTVLADNLVLFEGAASIDGDDFRVAIPVDVFIRFAQSKHPKLRVGGDTFKLTDDQIKTLNRLIATMAAEEKVSPAKL